MKLSIIVPCYNEGANVALLLEAYSAVITRPDIEIILVNNGSTDGTAEMLTSLTSSYGRFLKVVTVPVNQGYGYGILSGLRAASGEYIGWTHGDLQTPPRDVIAGLAIIESHNTPTKLYVKGTRKGRPLFDQFFTFGMSIFETLYLGTWLYDINAQPNIFHRSFFEHWDTPPHDFSFDLYVLYTAKKAGLTVTRFPVTFPPRIHGESNWNTSFKNKWKFIKRTFTFSVELKKRLH
jgi:glycosyltransferase involved in cell wall biosynthesis